MIERIMTKRSYHKPELKKCEELKQITFSEQYIARATGIRGMGLGGTQPGSLGGTEITKVDDSVKS